ncbi:MAG: hypothetical protein KAY37_05300 [Phycisphaerae bacterium]|nr:hypothetical protein [Phycisphaerae bacterium]
MRRLKSAEAFLIRAMPLGVIAIMLLVGCSSGPSPTDVVTTSGGTFEVTDPNNPAHGACLSVPEGAVMELTTITIIQSTNSPVLPDGIKGLGPVILFQTEATWFKKPVIVQVPYDPSLVSDPEKVMVLRYDENRGEWEIPSTLCEVDADKCAVDVPVRRLSLFTAAEIAEDFLLPSFDTGFRPGKHGFHIGNRPPEGARCGGMVGFAKWYFQEKGCALYRVADWIQESIAYQAQWAYAYDCLSCSDHRRYHTPEKALNKIKAAIFLSRQPQYVSVVYRDASNETRAHAMLAIGYEGDSVAFYNPNHPDQTINTNLIDWEFWDREIHLLSEPRWAVVSLSQIFEPGEAEGIYEDFKEELDETCGGNLDVDAGPDIFAKVGDRIMLNGHIMLAEGTEQLLPGSWRWVNISCPIDSHVRDVLEYKGLFIPPYLPHDNSMDIFNWPPPEELGSPFLPPADGQWYGKGGWLFVPPVAGTYEFELRALLYTTQEEVRASDTLKITVTGSLAQKILLSPESQAGTYSYSLEADDRLDSDSSSLSFQSGEYQDLFYSSTSGSCLQSKFNESVTSEGYEDGWDYWYISASVNGIVQVGTETLWHEMYHYHHPWDSIVPGGFGFRNRARLETGSGWLYEMQVIAGTGGEPLPDQSFYAEASVSLEPELIYQVVPEPIDADWMLAVVCFESKSVGVSEAQLWPLDAKKVDFRGWVHEEYDLLGGIVSGTGSDVLDVNVRAYSRSWSSYQDGKFSSQGREGNNSGSCWATPLWAWSSLQASNENEFRIMARTLDSFDVILEQVSGPEISIESPQVVDAELGVKTVTYYGTANEQGILVFNIKWVSPDGNILYQRYVVIGSSETMPFGWGMA